jgi:hypothetical protein
MRRATSLVRVTNDLRLTVEEEVGSAGTMQLLRVSHSPHK